MKNLIKRLTEKIFGKDEGEALQECLGEYRNIFKVESGPGRRTFSTKCSSIAEMKSIGSRFESLIFEEFNKLYKHPFTPALNFHYELPELVVKNIKDSVGAESVAKIHYSALPFGSRTEYKDIAVPEKYITLADKNGNEVVGRASASEYFWDDVVLTDIGNIVDVTLTLNYNGRCYPIIEFKNKS